MQKVSDVTPAPRWGAIQTPRPKRGEGVKFIAFFEFRPEDFDKMIEINNAFVEKKKKEPEKYPELIFGPYLLGGEFKGFAIDEVSNPEQITNEILHYMPDVKFRFVPLLDGYEAVELYQKMKE
jgi:hypothetical protein